MYTGGWWRRSLPPWTFICINGYLSMAYMKTIFWECHTFFLLGAKQNIHLSNTCSFVHPYINKCFFFLLWQIHLALLTNYGLLIHLSQICIGFLTMLEILGMLGHTMLDTPSYIRHWYILYLLLTTFSKINGTKISGEIKTRDCPFHMGHF